MDGLAGAYDVAIEPPPVPNTNAGIARANGRALDIMFGVQRAMLGEFVFAMAEVAERTRTETHLFNEFVSKMAASHSVRDIRTMWTECCKHQLDFVRRDCNRLFRHGERMIDRTARLFENRTEA